METSIQEILRSGIESPLRMNQQDQTLEWNEVCLESQLDEGAHDVQVCAITNQIRVCAVIGK